MIHIKPIWSLSRRVKVFDPLAGASAATALVRGVAHASAISFAVVDHPVVIEIVP